MSAPHRPTPPDIPTGPGADVSRDGSVKDGDLRTAMDLSDFMTQVGVLMRLPPRKAEATRPIAEGARGRRQGSTRPILPALAVIAMLGFVAEREWPRTSEPVPMEVRGTWTTTDSRYAGRQLVIDAFTVTSVVDSTAQGEWIQGVATHRLGGDTLAVVIKHGDGTALQELELAYVRGPSEHLTLRNPAGVTWTRRAVASP